jgi:RNA polymerase sigma factor (sigma-70 family)
MNVPDLKALQRGESAAWDEAFAWLWPTAFAAAQAKLQAFLPGDIEDAAIEALEELVEMTAAVKSTEELKPLAASIAHNRAVSRLREHFARKRGAGRTESLDAPRSDGETRPEPATPETPLPEVDQIELARLLGDLQAELKPEQRALLGDFFLHGLSYEQLAAKHGLALGTVGVYLKRGLEAMRRVAQKHPKLLKELEAFLR